MAKAFIVGPSYGFTHMFKDNGWEVVDNVNDADLVQFTGGEDINPAIYRHQKHSATYGLNPRRDNREIFFYNYAKEKGIAMAGVCRGLQLINCLSAPDGWLWQDVDNHCGYDHTVFDVDTSQEYMCNSIHHQMVAPPKGAFILAYSRESTVRSKMHGVKEIDIPTGNSRDPEVVYYPWIKSLGFQGHPEMGDKELQTIYFGYINKHLQLGV